MRSSEWEESKGTVSDESFLPPPSEYGFPGKFSEWRPEQRRIINAVLDTPEARFATVCAPTGCGKTGLYLGIAQILGLRTVILTSTKGLQQQLGKDFADTMGLRDVRGKGNYVCKALQRGGIFHGTVEVRDSNWYSVEEAPCFEGAKCQLKSGGCTYFDAINQAKKAQLIVTNYAKWMSEPIEFWGKEPELLVCDEAHAAPDEVCSHLSTLLEPAEIEPVLGQRLPTLQTIREWREWASGLAMNITNEIESVTEQLSRLSMMGSFGTREWKEISKRGRVLKGLAKKFAILERMVQGQWVFEYVGPGSKSVQFDPIWAAGFTEELLFKHISKVVLTSATIRPKHLSLLGIAPSKASIFLEAPSSFPVPRRPITQLRGVKSGKLLKLSYKSTDEQLDEWMATIDQVITDRLDRKGIIHTVSYKRQAHILTHSKHRNIMLAHDKRNTQKIVEEFKASGSPRVLVSPSVSTGFDFPFTDAEYVVISKVPFPDMRSKVLSARMGQDKEYGSHLAAQELVQMAGRGMRDRRDQCEILVADGHLWWFIFSNKHLFPKWFLEAVRKLPEGVMVPKPLPKLKENGQNV